MVGIISGNHGFSQSTATDSGLLNKSGDSGQTQGRVAVNIANRHLVLEFTDETLSGTGADLAHTRYNYGKHGGLFDDSDGDGWTNGAKRIHVVGTPSASPVVGSSKINYLTRDGSLAVAVWDGSAYVNKTETGAHDRITYNATTKEYLIIDGNSQRQEFADATTGNIKRMRDTSGNGFDYVYNTTGAEAGLLKEAKDTKSGQSLVYGYTSGKLSSISSKTTSTATAVLQVSYAYDTSGRLYQVKTLLSEGDAAKGYYTTTYTYSGTTKNITKIQQSDGSVVDIVYNSSGDVLSVTDHAGTTSFAYDTVNKKTTVTYGQGTGTGAVTTYQYDANSQITKITSSPAHGVTQSVSYGYDADGNITTITDGKGNVTALRYDTKGNLIKQRDGEGNTLTRTYDSNNNLLTETRYTATTLSITETPSATTALTTRYVYDIVNGVNTGRLRFVVSAEGRVTENLYTGNVFGLVSETKAYTDSFYAVATLAPTTHLTEAQLETWVIGLTAVQKQRVQLTTYIYDARGNLSEKRAFATISSTGTPVADSRELRTVYVYDPHGALLQKLQYRSPSTSGTVQQELYVRDGLGRVTKTINEHGTTTTVYSGNSVVSTNNGLSSTSQYNSRGQLQSIIQSGDAQQRSTNYFYTNFGQLFKTTTSDGVSSFQYYNAAGQLNYTVDAVGAVTAFSYDANGQLLEERQYATPIATGTLVATSNISTLVVASTTDRLLQYTYDKAGRVTRVLQENGASDQVTATTYNGASQVTATTQVTNSTAPSRVTQFAYDKDGLLTKTTSANGDITQHFYDSAGRRIRDTRGTGTAVLSSYYYYDAQGRQVGMVDERGFLSETIYEPGLFKTTSKRYLTPVTASTSSTLDTLRSSAGAAETTVKIFNELGRLSEAITPDNSKTLYFYDGSGRVVRTTEQVTTSRVGGTAVLENRQSFIRYNAFSEITGKVSGSGAFGLTATSTQTTINSAIDAKGRRYTYDAMGRKTAELSAEGQKTYFYYDKAGRMTYTANVLGEVSRTTYNTFGQVATTTVYATRISGTNLTTLNSAGGGSESLIASKIVTNTQDSTIQYGYNTLGQKMSTRSAEGKTDTFHYDGFNELREVNRLNSLGVNTGSESAKVYTRDSLGRVTQSQVHDGSRWISGDLVTYDGLGRVVANKNYLGHSSITEYRLGGREIKITDATSRTSITTYDALGRVAKTIDGFGNIATYTFNAAQRSSTVVMPGGSVTTWFNESGDKLAVKDANNKITYYTYTLDGQLDKVIDAKGNTVKDHDYDVSGRLKDLKDANGNIVRYSYDPANRTVSRIVNPGGLNITTSFTYTAKGEQLTVTKGTGAEVTATKYIYDKDGRLKQTIVDEGTSKLNLSTRLTYDNFGNVTLVERGTASVPAQTKTQYVYDGLGRKTREIIDPGTGGLNITTQYVYDDIGNVTQIKDARGNSTWNFYDGANRLTRTINQEGAVTEFTYNSNGQIWKTVERINRFTGSPSLDAKMRATGYTAVPVSANDRTLIAVFDNNGRQTHTIKDTGGNIWTVSQSVYDAAGNVTATYRYAQTLTNADVVGFSADNQITVAELAGKSLTTAKADTRITRFAYDANNRLRFTVSAEGAVVETSYDNAGNVRYVTEFFNRYTVGATTLTEGAMQTWATGQANRKTEYQYDGAGRQIKTILPGYYDPSTGKVGATIPTGAFQRTIDVRYDTLGNAVLSRVQTGVSTYVTQYKTYDAAGRQVFDIDGLGYATKSEYDATSNTTKSIRYANALSSPDQTASGLTYWSSSTVAKTLEGSLSRTITTVYDKAGRKINIKQEASTAYYGGSYTANANPLGTTTGTPETVYEYNAVGQVTATKVRVRASGSGQWAITYNNYDRAGQLTLQVHNNSVFSGSTYTEKLYATSNEYNAFGEVVKTREYVNPTSSSILAPTTNIKDRVTRYEYDTAGRMTRTLRDNLTYNLQSGNTWAVQSGINGKVISANTYNTFNEVASTTDALNNVTSYAYDKLGQIKTVTAPSRTTAAASGDDPFRSVSTNVRPTTTFTYDVFGQSMQEVISAGGGRGETITLTHKYDMAGNEIESTDGNSNVVFKQYDVAGRVIKTKQAVSVTAPVSTMSYISNIEQRFVYDAAGRQIATVDIYNTSKLSGQYNHYNAFGEVITEKRIWGTTTATQLYAGDVTALANGTASQTVNSYAYDKTGRIASKQSSDGTTVYFYDLGGNVTRTEMRGNSTTTAAEYRITEAYYDLRGNALTQRAPTYLATASNLNTIALTGDVPVATTLVTPKITQVFDRWGNVTKVTDVAGQTTSYEYDHNNQAIKETGPTVTAWKTDGTSVATQVVHTATYNLLGQLATDSYSTTNAGLTATRSKYNLYNNIGQLTATVDYSFNGAANLNTVEYAYDAHGNKVGTRRPSGVLIVDEYDRNNQHVKKSVVRNYVIRTSEVYVGYGETSTQTTRVYSAYNSHTGSTLSTERIRLAGYQYDQAGRKYAELNATQNNTTLYAYDDRGLMSRSRNVVGGITYYLYDEFGNKTSMAERDGGTNLFKKGWTYSKAHYEHGRILNHTVGDGSTNNRTYNYSYTGFGQLKREQHSTSTSTYVENTYLANGLLATIKDNTGETGNSQTFTTDLWYDIRGNRTKEKNTSITTGTTYSGYGATTSSPYSQSSTMISLYSYDNLGRLSSVRSPQGTMRAQSDTKATGKLDKLEYRYDEWSNRRAIIAASYRLVASSVDVITPRAEYYTYDAEGRTLVEGGALVNAQIVATKRQGQVNEYDGDGRLKTVEAWSHTENTSIVSYGSPTITTAVAEIYRQQKYTYNDLNLATTIDKRTLRRAVDGTSASSTTYSAYTLAETHLYSERGFRYKSSIVNGNTTFSDYRSDGSLTYQRVSNSSGKTVSIMNGYVYDSFGNMKEYKYEHYSSGVKQFTNTYYYAYSPNYAGYQVKEILVNSSQGGTAEGRTLNTYDQRGRLKHSRVTQSSGSTTGYGYKYFIHNAEGFINGTMEKRHGQTTYKGENFYYFKGGQLATITQGTIDLSPLKAVHMGSSTPSSVTVSSGDTLSTLSQSVYGDSSLWYVIADANGLSLGPSQAFSGSEVGRSLVIPNTSQTVKNDSTTFKPYNPTEIIGDLTPDPAILPPPKKSCNALATIVMIAIAVVVTVFTAGAAAVALGAATTGGMAGIGSAGLAALAGTTGAATIGGSALAATVASAAMGGFVGSAASQLAGKGMGVVESFSLRQAVSSGLTAGFAAGAGNYLQSAQNANWATTGNKSAAGVAKLTFRGNMARGAASYLGGIAANGASGLKTSFNWTDMAIASVSSGVSGKIPIPGANVNPGVGFGADIANSYIGSAVSGSLSRLFGRGGEPDWEAMAVDAFGNAVGNAAVSGVILLGQKKENDDKMARHLNAMSEELTRKIEQQAPEVVLSPKNNGEISKSGAVVVTGDSSSNSATDSGASSDSTSSDYPLIFSKDIVGDDFIEVAPGVLVNFRAIEHSYFTGGQESFEQSVDIVWNALAELDASFDLSLDAEGGRVSPWQVGMEGRDAFSSGMNHVLNDIGRSQVIDAAGLIASGNLITRFGATVAEYAEMPARAIITRLERAVSGGAASNTAFSADDLVRQINLGGDTSYIASALARQFTHSAPGPNSGSVILGRWSMTLDGPGTSSMGYIDIAKRGGGTWFETPDTFWPQLREGFVNSGADPRLAMRMADDAAFRVNEQFLFQQAKDGVQFKLVNTTPRHAEQYFRNSATLREIDLLNSDQFKALGYVKKGNSWVRGQ